MDESLGPLLTRAESLLARLENWLPPPAASIDWQHCLAVRWQRDGRHGRLQALQVNLQLRISDLCGVERQVAQLAGNTRQFLQGLPDRCW